MIRTAAELAALRDRARRVLCVMPHPDDESYGPAGTLARAGADPEGAAVVFCMTRGEASSMGRERGMSRDAVAALRSERMEQVGSLLQLDGLLLGDFPDGRMAYTGLDEMAAAIGGAMDALRPQVVIGHDPRGVNAHPDHIATHWAIRQALLTRDSVRFAMMAYLQDVADLVAPRLLFATPEDEIDAVIDLSPAEADAKEACLRVHEALITLRDDGDPELLRRPPIERYAFFGETRSEPVSDLFVF